MRGGGNIKTEPRNARIANGLPAPGRDFPGAGQWRHRPGITEHALRARMWINTGWMKWITAFSTIIEKFKGACGHYHDCHRGGRKPGTLEEVYEPFLIREGFLQRTQGAGGYCQSLRTHRKEMTRRQQPSFFRIQPGNKAWFVVKRQRWDRGSDHPQIFSATSSRYVSYWAL